MAELVGARADGDVGERACSGGEDELAAGEENVVGPDDDGGSVPGEDKPPGKPESAGGEDVADLVDEERGNSYGGYANEV